MIVIDFFKYYIYGWWNLLYIIIMLIFALACLGVVGDKIAKKKHAEMLARREAKAKIESDKAREVVKKQSGFSGVDTSSQNQQANIGNGDVNSNNITLDTKKEVEDINVQQEVIILDAPIGENKVNDVKNVTDIIENNNEKESNTEDKSPSMLIINDDGTSNVSVN